MKMKYSERAFQVWQILLGLAYNRQTLTYERIAEIIGIGFNAAIAMRDYLEPIMKYCYENYLPPLTILIVNKNTGLLGIGLKNIKNLNKEREDVFRKEWYKKQPIQISDLEPFS
jgi:putative restriction endonuclease